MKNTKYNTSKIRHAFATATQILDPGILDPGEYLLKSLKKNKYFFLNQTQHHLILTMHSKSYLFSVFQFLGTFDSLILDPRNVQNFVKGLFLHKRLTALK